MEFSLEQLGMAYRKAKVDLYYTTLPPLMAMVQYEDNLMANLGRLQEQLLSADEKWLSDPELVGDWTVTAKSLAPLGQKDFGETVFSDASEEWLAQSGGSQHKCKAQLRIMSDVSLDFHVLSALWLSEVGHQFDKALSKSAFGSRLRRTDEDKFNPLSLGSFKPYLRPFRQWRDGGIAAMRSALAEDKKVVALTADVAAFYHELRPDFLLDPSFQRLCEVELSADQAALHRVFVDLLRNWAKSTPSGKGLPVGLPASALVANLALLELDRLIERETCPIYYGRYVDDILLVLENRQGFTKASEVWEWLFGRASGMLRWDTKEKNAVRFEAEYLRNSRIRFANNKNKVFILSGESGKTLVSSIAQQIHERASEWRALPDLPVNVEHVATALASATQDDGERADNLRKTSSMSMKRASFAIKLRDFEAHGRDLDPGDWADHRHAFLAAVNEHVVAPDAFFDLCNYLPRVIRLATACEDFDWLQKIVESVTSLLDCVAKSCEIELYTRGRKYWRVTSNELMTRWKAQLFRTYRENIIAAMPTRLSSDGARKWASFLARASELYPDIKIAPLKDMQAQHIRLFCADLAYAPFRNIGLPKEMSPGHVLPFKQALTNFSEPAEPLVAEVTEGAGIVATWSGLKGQIPRAFLYATRPYNLAELYLLRNGRAAAADSINDLRAVLIALRGFAPELPMPAIGADGRVVVPTHESPKRLVVAVTSWKTMHSSWVAAVTKRSDPDLGRYARMNRLVNGVISEPSNARYLVMPELSMKPRWFVRTAQKLQGRGISLIAGVEYQHATRRRVRNQVWASLIHDGMGFPSLFVYRQDKQAPALHERKEIKRLANLSLQPETEWKLPPVVQHGDFFFSLLVCSELTNIAYRASLRGRVDAVIVPEWNQDTESFNALVESAALDIHAYIVQCNDRSFGDSRIRAPHKDSWRRDILRVRGGLNDYCVIAEIDIHSLRQFQSSHFSPDGPFKPVPDGFRIAFERQVLPSAE